MELFLVKVGIISVREAIEAPIDTNPSKDDVVTVVLFGVFGVFLRKGLEKDEESLGHLSKERGNYPNKFPEVVVRFGFDDCFDSAVHRELWCRLQATVVVVVVILGWHPVVFCHCKVK